MSQPFTFRFAQPEDCQLILTFIRGLAEYEHLADEVVATPQLLHEWIFEKKKAEVLFICDQGTEVGFALFFHNFSTFLGRAGIYLEDLFVLPEHRGKGCGGALLRRLARIAKERAEEQLRQKQSIVEFHHSQASLSRAMARLKESSKYKREGY